MNVAVRSSRRILVVVEEFCYWIVVMVTQAYTWDKMTEVCKTERRSQGFNDVECQGVCEARKRLAADLDTTSGLSDVKATLLCMFTKPRR